MKKMRMLMAAMLAMVCLISCFAIAENVAPTEPVASPKKPAPVVEKVIIPVSNDPEQPAKTEEEIAVIEAALENLVVEVVETEQWSEPVVEAYNEVKTAVDSVMELVKKAEEIAAAIEAGEITAEEAEVVEPVNVVEVLFNEEEIKAVEEKLPEEYDTAKLTVAEYIPMTVENYTEEIGDIAMHFELPGEYAEEDVVIAMLKPLGGDESSWIALDAKVVADEAEAEAEAEEAEETEAEAQADAEEETGAEEAAEEVFGKVEITFTQEALKMINANEAIVLILRGTDK